MRQRYPESYEATKENAQQIIDLEKRKRQEKTTRLRKARLQQQGAQQGGSTVGNKG
jgi:hypothetical protein